MEEKDDPWEVDMVLDERWLCRDALLREDAAEIFAREAPDDAACAERGDGSDAPSPIGNESRDDPLKRAPVPENAASSSSLLFNDKDPGPADELRDAFESSPLPDGFSLFLDAFVPILLLQS